MSVCKERPRCSLHMILKIRFVTSLLEPRQNASENPSHLSHPSRSTTATLTPLGVVIVFGGWVCVVSNPVLSSFKMKPRFANATTSSSSKHAACCDDVARTANLKSNKGPPPSSNSILAVLTRSLHLLRAHSNAQQNSLRRWVELSWFELSWIELSWASRPAGGPLRAQAERNDSHAKYVHKNVCYRGILLVLVAWAVHDILGNPNFMRIAGTHLPRAPQGSAMPPCCLRDWSWRTLSETRMRAETRMASSCGQNDVSSNIGI